ncbi:hypothetical protein BaRGS_00009462 [Batillaria attramentaria]|uniref:Uncharacterized protein n=1 Tax=Batillaria attramentaria TaxID=370345 RepID=A0ABD0LI15_9CAEN
MACRILKSRFLQAAKTHESGKVDRATAYNNLCDICEGKKAARSSYACDECPSGPPGGFVCLSATLLKYLVNIQSMGAVTINELAGGCHSCESRHYSGLAVTLKSDRRSPDYIRVCEGMRGYAQDKGEHVQCQFYDGPHPNGFEF